VLTRDIDRLGAFYREVLQIQPSSRGAYMEFQTEPGIFSLWSLDEFEQTAGTRASEGMGSGSVMLEFQVEDVDREYARLQRVDEFRLDFILPPTTLPWGNRAIYFRDPEGNLVNFFSRVG
jgi:catechol 2,3-dioxygenase-like lactoylglutathione lyase family enzyme